MRVLLTLTILLFAGFSKAQAADACITGIKENISYQSFGAFDDYLVDGAAIYKAAYSCQDVDIVSNGLKATALVAQVGAMASACAIGGVPVAVVLQGAVIGLGAIDLYVSNLDCVDEEQEAKIKEQVDDAVCSALNAQGIECLPPLEMQDSVLL